MLKKRIEYLDIVRGIGILYMIYGHITYFEKYDHYIHAFHMPLFFFITGYFFHSNESLSWKDFLIKNIKKLLVPYFIIGILYAIIDGVFFNGTNSIIKNIVTVLTINNNNFPIAGAFWFLTCLFFASIIFYLLIKYIKNDLLLGIISFLIMLFGIYFKRILKIELWLSLIPALVSVGFIELGYLTRRKKILEKYSINSFLVLIIIFIINLFCILNTKYVNMRTSQYPSVLLLLINFIVAMTFYINISKKIDEINIIQPFLKIIKNIGRYSIIYLIINQFIIMIIKIFINKLFVIDNNSFIFSISVFLITVVIINILTKYIIKSRIKFIFGL